MLFVKTIPTRDGNFTASFSEHGLVALDFPSEKETARSKPTAGEPPAKVRQWMQMATDAVQAIVRGQNPPALPPIDLPEATDFQRAIWAAIARIPAGQTCTYGDLAVAIGRPDAIRAAGTACGANRVPLLIPCHRVLPKAGGLGQFTAGTKWKELLLEREGVNPQSPRAKNRLAKSRRAHIPVLSNRSRFRASGRSASRVSA